MNLRKLIIWVFPFICSLGVTFSVAAYPLELNINSTNKGTKISFPSYPQSTIFETNPIQSEIISTIEPFNSDQGGRLEIDNPVMDIIDEMEFDFTPEEIEITDTPTQEIINMAENKLKKQQFDKTVSFVKAVLATLKTFHMVDEDILIVKDSLATVGDMQGVADVLAEVAADKIGMTLEELDSLLEDEAVMGLTDEVIVKELPPSIQSVLYIALLVSDEEAIDLLLEGDTSKVSDILLFVVKVMTEKLS